MRSIVTASDHGFRLDSRADVADLVSLCYGADGVLLDESDLGDAFFQLETGLAGELLQKLSTYRIQTAIVCADRTAHGPRFAELAREHDRHPLLRFFPTPADAQRWLSAAPAPQP